MAELQGVQKEALSLLSPAVHSSRVSYRPLLSILGEPFDVLHCEKVELASAFRGISGRWAYVFARRGTPSARRIYSVRLGPLPVRDAMLFLFRDEERVSEAKTDKNGRAPFNFPCEPALATYTVSILPVLAPFKTPLQESFDFSTWLVTCRITNKTDIWWRYVGRSFTGVLPRNFWRNRLTTIGVIGPVGTQSFIDMVPVFGDKDAASEYGISAMCNTPEPLPTHERCLAYRRNTWWHFEVEAFNGKTRKKVSGDLNVDRHLRVTFATDNISGVVVRPTGAET